MQNVRFMVKTLSFYNFTEQLISTLILWDDYKCSNCNHKAGLLSLVLFLATFPQLGLIGFLYIKIIIVAVTIALILDTYLDIINYDYGSQLCNEGAKQLGLFALILSIAMSIMPFGESVAKLVAFIVGTYMINVFSNISHYGLETVCKKK